MTRLVVCLGLLVGCGSPTPPPSAPTRASNEPPTIPVVEFCDSDSLPFSSAWGLPVGPPVSDQEPTESLYEGVVELPASLYPDSSTITGVQIFDTEATFTVDATSDPILLSYSATATCESDACRWVEATVVDANGTYLLQAPTPDVISLDTTARMALDFSRAFAAARIGATGLVEGQDVAIDALVPGVRDVIELSLASGAGSAVGAGGFPVPGTPTFDAVDVALASSGFGAPGFTDQAIWGMQTAMSVPEARLVLFIDDFVTTTINADSNGDFAMLLGPPTQASTVVARFVTEDGSQSAATVFEQSAVTLPGAPSLTLGEANSLNVSGATPGNWILQQSLSGAASSGCEANDSGSGVLTVDPTSRFVFLELAPTTFDVVSFAICERTNEGLECS